MQSNTLVQLIALCLQTAFYIPYLWTFVLCLRIFLRNRAGCWKTARDIDWTVVILAVSLWLIATINLVLGALRTIRDLSRPVDPGDSDKLGSISLIKVLDDIARYVVSSLTHVLRLLW